MWRTAAEIQTGAFGDVDAFYCFSVKQCGRIQNNRESAKNYL